MTPSRRPTLRTTAAAALAVAGLGLTSCGAATTDTTDEVEETQSTQEEGILEGGAPDEPYVGPYDSAFVDVRDDYAGMDVVLTGEVQETVAAVGFTITGPEDSTVEPLLVFYNPDEASPEAGETVAVTGTIHEVFNPPVVEENVGGEPGSGELAYYHGQPFLRAENVAVAAPEDAAPTG